jgi:hypothetical protein
MTNQIVKVEFQGGELEAIQKNKKVWVSVRRVCEALGIDDKTQKDKLKTKEWATWGLIPSVGADGKTREQFMIDLDSFPMWLGTIETNRVSEEIRPMLVTYQKQAAKVLRDHFFGKHPENPEEKEDRLWERERRLAAQQKAKGWRIYKRIAEQQQRAELAATYDIKIAEVLTGNPQPILLPKTGEKADWVSPEQIADRLGVSVQRMGLTISALWGKGQRLDIEGIREVRTGPAANGRQVPLSFYSSRAVDMIQERLIEDGYIQCGAAQRDLIEKQKAEELAKRELELYLAARRSPH